MANEISKPQRALILQGGGALGAYEAGVFRAIYDKLFEPDKALFDIVIGTSIGAINGAVLTSYVKHNKTWKGSADRLIEFWKHLASPTPFIAKSSEYWWGEAGRRYYATKHFLYRGVENIFSAPKTEYDSKFLDNMNVFEGLPNVNPNIWHKYDNTRLQKSLEHEGKDGEKFVKFPISTSIEDDEPRFLTVAADIQEGSTVTFDSYPKFDGSRETEYGIELTDSEPPQIKNPGYVIAYEDGIKMEHVIASASVPVHYDHVKIKGSRLDASGNPTKISSDRYFWDGGILSNTPLRELLSEHKKFWGKRIESQKQSEETDSTSEIEFFEKNVPDLEVYIVNVWTKKEQKIPQDHDSSKDRKNDIVYCDKTNYDEKVARFISDYIGLTRELMELAKTKGATKDELDKILKTSAESRFRTNKSRDYADLLKGRFRLNKVVRIERQDDIYTISNKHIDFTKETICDLIEKGYEEAFFQM